jgi:branched-chain amino acid transport system permease protein
MRSGHFKESYAADESIVDSGERAAWAGALALALLALPWLASDYWVYMACLLGINIVAAVGLNLLTGYTGLLSIGHAAFIAVGAYAAAVAALRFGAPFWLAIPLGGLAAAAAGILVGLPSLRIKGLYLAIATLSAQFIVIFLIREWSDVTGGDGGLTLQPAALGGLLFDTDRKVYYIVMPVTVALVVFARNLFRTRIGRAFIAVRERDFSAEVLGVNLLRTKLASFALSAFYAGVAGALMAFFFKIVNPEQFTFGVSIFFLAAIIVGGLGSILGSILGAVFMTMVPELLKIASALLPGGGGARVAVLLAPVREIVFGLLIVGFLLFEPHGLAEIWRRIREIARLWPFRV